MGESENQIPLDEKNTDRWGYDSHFYEYLLRVEQNGNEALESIDNFPERIELNDIWHRVLNKMREETRDGYERWTPIGLQDLTRKVIIPSDFSIGDKNSFTKKVSNEELQKYKMLGIVSIVGDIHSHPRHFESFTRRFLSSGRILAEYQGFSPPDLKGNIEQHASSTSPHVFGVVHEKGNFFAFLTKETEAIPIDSPLQDTSEFTYYWFRKFAPSILEKLPPVKSTLWNINIGIAEQYKLAIYRGEVGKDLIRGFPFIKGN